MAWTTTTLKQAIRDTVQVQTETYFDNNLDNFILAAEDRILKAAQLPDFRKLDTTLTTTDGDPYLSVPSDFLAPYSLAIVASNVHTLLIPKAPSYMREAYPDVTSEAKPKYYALFDETRFILAPTPDTDYATELRYFYRPTSITATTTTWLGTNAPRCLLYASVVEAYTFLKGNPEEMAMYEQYYQESLAAEKLLGEGRAVTDEFRSA